MNVKTICRFFISTVKKYTLSLKTMYLLLLWMLSIEFFQLMYKEYFVCRTMPFLYSLFFCYRSLWMIRFSMHKDRENKKSINSFHTFPFFFVRSVLCRHILVTLDNQLVNQSKKKTKICFILEQIFTYHINTLPIRRQLISNLLERWMFFILETNVSLNMLCEDELWN